MSKVLWGVVLSVHASEDASTSESSKRRVIVMTGIEEGKGVKEGKGVRSRLGRLGSLLASLVYLNSS